MTCKMLCSYLVVLFLVVGLFDTEAKGYTKGWAIHGLVDLDGDGLIDKVGGLWVCTKGYLWHTTDPNETNDITWYYDCGNPSHKPGSATYGNHAHISRNDYPTFAHDRLPCD